MTDLEKSGVSVKTLIICMAAILTTCFGIMGTGLGVAYYTGKELSQIDSTLAAHSTALVDLTTTVQKQSETLATSSAAQQANQALMQSEIANLKLSLITPSSRWTWGMQREHDREEHELNPSYAQPDDEKIHENLQPQAQ